MLKFLPILIKNLFNISFSVLQEAFYDLPSLLIPFWQPLSYHYVRVLASYSLILVIVI